MEGNPDVFRSNTSAGARVAALLDELVRIDSVNPALGGPQGGEAQVADRIGEWCRGLGADVEWSEALPGRPNVVAKFIRDASYPTLVFEGHTDTVNAVGMERPFTPRIEGRRLYGRGACDTKGGIAAALCALERLTAIDDLPLNVEFVGAVDEEIGFQGVLHYLAGTDGTGAAVVIEPTSLVPVVSHAGVLRGRLGSSGVAAHSSRAALGENAIDKMIAALPNLQQWAASRKPSTHHLTGTTTFSITGISGGEAINTIPRACTADFDWRLHPSDDPALALADLRHFLSQNGPDVEVVELLLQDSGLDTPLDAVVVQAAQAACEAVTGLSEPTGVGWGSDASKFARQTGWEAVVLGPGSAAQAHTDAEWVNLDEVEAAADIYVNVAIEYASRTSG